ncbi:MAG: outer membrane protein assembly factor BamA [Candidatus Krumholzibacteria bacterium]|nr:outer membrane protein assembly factor BamA [Candidatus Krumholzibacteria bacterium]MDP6668856.1 outer membrane protein assembly factor BamA [Candidatus Krumholzibacteria bacterium]MDP6796421.1 outer membrane protein assembly factor BamA [Candidatus Krumholzibacteria bacterium]MDP7020810.1 outer membrane protein assembly factor BamA [Candidatus Krumholzibacteria bacterium]
MKILRFLVFFCLLSLPFQVEAVGTATIDSVRVEGLRHVAAGRVLLEFGIQKGDPLDSERIAEGIRRLYRTHRFENVETRLESLPGGSRALVLLLREFPRLSDIRWEGLRKMDQKDLEEKISLTKGRYLRPLLVSQAKRAILEHCREEGYHSATLEVVRKEQGEGEELLIFRLDEGKKAKIQHLVFEGVKSRDSSELKKVLQCRPRSLNPLTWFNSDSYHPDSLELDEQRLLTEYHDSGYLDMKVLDRQVAFSEDQEEVTLTWIIEEGSSYEFGEIHWSGNTIFSDSVIEAYFPFEPGEEFQGADLRGSLSRLGSEYYDHGYLYSQVQTDRRKQGNQVDLHIDIFEGPLARIREVVVAGNEKTLDKVIRREIRVFPGELFSQEKLIRSQRDIFMLRYFDDVQLEPKTDPASGDVDLVFHVKEREAGQFGTGISYSELSSIAGFIQLGTPNLFGRGRNLDFNWEFGKRVNYFKVNYSDSWFRDRPVHLTVSLYRNENNYYREYYRDRKAGISFGLGRPLPWLDHTRVSLSYRLENLELYDFSELYVEMGGTLLERDWPQIESSLSMNFWRNSTDNPFLPSRGSRFRLISQFSGGPLGGKLHFQKYDLSYTWYQKVAGPLVLRFHQSMGLVDGLNRPSQVPDHERFRMGGNRIFPLRGYEDFSIVPEGNSPFLGGRAMSSGSLELVLGINNSVQLIVPFFDFGDTWNSLAQADLTTLKRSVGVGARIEVPMMGVVGFDWAYPLDGEEGEPARFHFKMGGDF